MRWIVDRQIGLNNSGVEWVRQLLASRDTSRIDWLRIDFGRGAKRGAYGRCWYPARDRGKGYRISVQVPGPFPWTMERYTKPLYRTATATKRRRIFLTAADSRVTIATTAPVVSGNN